MLTLDENLGFMFATGQMNNGVKLPNVQIRIGGPRETDVAGCPLGNLKCMRRALGAYLSQRDLQQMGARLKTRLLSPVPFHLIMMLNKHYFSHLCPRGRSQ